MVFLWYCFVINQLNQFLIHQLTINHHRLILVHPNHHHHHHFYYRHHLLHNHYTILLNNSNILCVGVCVYVSTINRIFYFLFFPIIFFLLFLLFVSLVYGLLMFLHNLGKWSTTLCDPLIICHVFILTVFRSLSHSV